MKKDGNIVNIIGDLGDGKTLLTTYLSLISNRKIYSNYEIKIDRYVELTPEILLDINQKSYVILDEAYTWIDSRNPMKDENKFMSYMMFQARKRKVNFLMTTQMEQTIDLRFRYMTNIYIFAESTPNGFKYDVYTRGKGKIKTFFMPMSLARKVFPYYDTYKTVNAVDDALMSRISKDKGKISENVDNYVNEMLKRANAKDWTKGIVKDYCLQNSIPGYMADMLYNRIKARKIGL